MSQLALKLCYQEDRALVGGYPGSRAVITLDTVPLVGAMNKLWGEPLQPFHSDYHPIIFSAIIDRNYKPSVWQRQTHIDQRVTAMMYLNPEGMCPEEPVSTAARRDWSVCRSRSTRRLSGWRSSMA